MLDLLSRPPRSLGFPDSLTPKHQCDANRCTDDSDAVFGSTATRRCPHHLGGGGSAWTGRTLRAQRRRDRHPRGNAVLDRTVSWAFLSIINLAHRDVFEEILLERLQFIRRLPAGNQFHAALYNPKLCGRSGSPVFR